MRQRSLIPQPVHRARTVEDLSRASPTGAPGDSGPGRGACAEHRRVESGPAGRTHSGSYFPQSSAAEPNPREANLGQPNLGQPNLEQPNPAQPNLGQPNLEQPNPGQPNPAQPNPAQHNPAQPNPAQPNPTASNLTDPSLAPPTGCGGFSPAEPHNNEHSHSSRDPASLTHDSRGCTNTSDAGSSSFVLALPAQEPPSLTPQATCSHIGNRRHVVRSNSREYGARTRAAQTGSNSDVSLSGRTDANAVGDIQGLKDVLRQQQNVRRGDVDDRLHLETQRGNRGKVCVLTGSKTPARSGGDLSRSDCTGSDARTRGASVSSNASTPDIKGTLPTEGAERCARVRV